MIQIKSSLIDNILSERFGISLEVINEKNMIDIRPSDLPPGQGFIVRISFGWRSIAAEFIPDNFSAALLRAMASADESKRTLFRNLVGSCLPNNAQLIMRVNGLEVEPLTPQHWPVNWGQILIKLTRMPVVQEELNSEQIVDLVLDTGGCLLGLVLSLLPLEESATEDNLIGLPEGAVSRIEVNKYERNSINRQACIMIHGCVCKICRFDFKKVYGLIGEGYIHVHHVVPVSMLGPDYIINPAKDLIPVCPNCHAMLHRRNPPFTEEELREIIKENN